MHPNRGKPGSELPPEERADIYKRIVEDFGRFLLRDNQWRNINPREAIARALVAAHHWPPLQARQVEDRDLGLCLPKDWQAFWGTLEEEDLELLEAWPEEHRFPRPLAAKPQR